MLLHGTLDIDMSKQTGATLLRLSPFHQNRTYLAFPVVFQRPFAGLPPNVMLSITKLDAREGWCVSYSIEAQKITLNGFDMVLGVVERDINTIQVSWLAINSTWPTAAETETA